MANDNAPFEVGQKVVSLIQNDIIDKGQVFTVRSIYPACCTWFIDIGLTSPIDLSMVCKCKMQTLLVLVKGGPFNPEAQCFAPYNPYSNSVSKELADKAMNVGDSADQPIKIKEPVLS